MKKFISLFWAVCIALPLFAQERGKIDVPDLKGYVTLKCDFHMHTVFSDGLVWPTVRVDDAYTEGLDAISITEHLENRRYVYDLSITHNRSYDIALPVANEKGIILIKGSEITRAMPPGHHNAIFLTNSDELANKPDYMDAFRAAKAQNAFIFWNHPGWDRQQPDTTRWFDEHTKLLEQGMMHGIEVVNGQYYPEAHRWCMEKNLTLIGVSDVHQPLQTHYAAGKLRAMTLVFARSRTAEAIHEALKERRTAILFGEDVIGEEKYLKELFENALEWKMEKTGNNVNITVRNKSDLTFRLKKTSHDARLVYFRNFTIRPRSIHTFTITLQDNITGGDVNFSVENFLVQPNEGMKYTIKI